MTDWRSSLRADPTPWLLEVGCEPLRYRVYTELLDGAVDPSELVKLRADVHSYGPAMQIQKRQAKDGSWSGRMFMGESDKPLPSLEAALTRLFEYGWSRDTKAIRDAAKGLRAFLTAKKDLNLFEFSRASKGDPRRERFHRWQLRNFALGLLIRAGYVDDKSRANVLDLLDQTAGFVDNPVSRSPVEEIGASQPMIRLEAWRNDYIFVPDLHITKVFAWSPWLLEGELAKMRLKKVYDYLVSPTYQSIAPDLGLVRTLKGHFVKGGGLRLRSLDQYLKDGHLDEMLGHLELFARLGLINRYPLLMAHLEWLQAQQGKDGHWNFPAKLYPDNDRWASVLRIERDWRTPVRREADLTFRVLLIFKLQWDAQMSMLDRRDDTYPI